MDLHFKQITNFEDFQNLKEDWNHLVKSSEIDHAFMRHEWFECWIKHLMPDGKLFIHTAWQNNQLVAIAPFQITKQVRKFIPIKLLSFLRSSITPRSNFIIDDSIDANLFFDSVFSSKGWDVAELKAIETGIPTTNNFIEYLKNKNSFVIEKGLQSPYDIIDTDWDSYLKKRSTKFKNNYKSSLNRLKKSDGYEIIRIESFEAIDKYFNNMVDISGKSWKLEGKTDLKSMPRMAKFYYDFCRLSSEDNLFLSNVLTIDNNPVAFDFYLRFNNRLVVLRWEYNEQFKYYKPGIVLQNHTIKSMLDAGVKLEFDCSGMSTPHKLEMVSNIREHIDITIGKPGLYGGMIMTLKKKLMQSDDIASEFI